MKRIGIIGLVVVFMLSLLPLSAVALTDYGTVVGGWLRLRTGPSYDATIIKSYYTGTVVQILGASGDWYNVKTPDNQAGYMYAAYINLGGGGTTAYVTSANGYSVNMRTGPGKGYRVLAVYAVGTEVTMLQEGVIWSRIQVGTTVGYMMSEFLTTSPSPTTPPSGDMATVWSSNGYGVRLRSGPGTSYSIIGLYSVGTRVAVQTRGTTWDYILVGSRLGYMMNEFLIYDHSAVPVATDIAVTADSSTGMQGEYVGLNVTVSGTNLSNPAYTLAVTGNPSMAEISGDDLHILSTATVGAVIEVTATSVDNNASGVKITDTCTVTVTAAVPRVTAFSFDQAAATVSIASGDVDLRIGYTISGYNLSSPYFTLNVPASVSPHVTATVDETHEEVVISVASTITAGTVFTITGTTVANDSGGNPKTATITITVTDEVVTLTSIELVPTRTSVRYTETSLINATLHYSDGSYVLNASYPTKYTLAITSGTAATLSGKELQPDLTLIGVPNETVTVTGTSVDNPTLIDTCAITIVARNVPGQPTINTAIAGHASVALDWDAVTDDGGDAITGYIVSYSDDPAGVKTVDGTTGPSTTDYVVSGLTDGAIYYFYVQATNPEGNSAYSAYKAATPTAVAPSAPTAIAVTAETNQQVSLSWGPPTSDGGSALTEYRVYYRRTADTANTLFSSVTPATTSETVTGLTNGTGYTFSVYAYNAIGASTAATITGTPATVPSAPQTLAVDSHGNGSVSISWVAPASTGGSALTEYTIIYNDGSDHTFTRAPGDVLNVTETVTGLTNGTTYTFTVFAVNAKGTSVASNAVTGTPSTVPAIPGLPTATAASATSVDLTWTTPADNGSAITGYTVTYQTGTDPVVTFSNPGAAATAETVTDLTTGTTYTFYIYAVNANGSSAAAIASETTP